MPAKFAKTLGRTLDARPDRLDLARWIVDPTNPLPARVIVNRLWKRYLGLGLFEPQDDFRLDHAPSHPELLAWLADDFMRCRKGDEVREPGSVNQIAIVDMLSDGLRKRGELRYQS